jgi:phosphatidylinositol glycan class S
LAGAKTSFTHVYGLRLGEALQRNKAVYPAEFAAAAFCEGYEARCDSCARTWMRPHAMDNLL